MAYDTTSPVPKQSCSKKLNIVPFMLMINHKPVLPSAIWYIFLVSYSSCFSQLKALQIIPQKNNRSSDT